MNEIKAEQLNPIYTPTLVKIQNPEVELEHVNSFCEDKPQSQIEKKKNEMKSSEQENNNLISQAPEIKYDHQLELKWENITIKTKPTAGACKKPTELQKSKTLLSNVSGSVKSGEALAIIGGSGAGKTTLLNFLSKRIDTGNLISDGKVKLNEIEVRDNNSQSNDLFFKGTDLEAISAYVMQDDILESTMTPKEILLFTAKLKLSLPEVEIENRVNLMLNELHLNNCKNTKIGDEKNRGVSGGERKRTSIGVELIGDPKIVFLDEPTTGLDSFNAYEVVQNLCDLAVLEGKIIIFTIHQPSSEIFEILQKIFIVADGKEVYFGPSKDTADFFENKLDLPFPKNYNPFEYFIETTNFDVLNHPIVNKHRVYKDIFKQIKENDDVSRHTAYSDYIQLLSDIYHGKKQLPTKIDDCEVLSTDLEKTNMVNTEYNNMNRTDQIELKKYVDQMIEKKKITKGFLYEFGMLFGRTTIIATRNAKILFFKVIQNLVVAVLLALTKNINGIQDRVGIIFLNMVGMIFGATTGTILIFAEERKVFLREQSNKLYSVGSYFLAKTLSELPIYFISVNMYIVVLYFSVQLNDTFSYKYFAYVGVLQLLSLGGSSYAYFMGSLASNQEALSNINAVFNVPLMLLSGFFATYENFAPYLIPFEYISVFKYGFQILTGIEFSNMQALNCQNSLTNACDPLKDRFTYKEEPWVSVICIIALIFGFNIAAFIITFYKSKLKS